MKIPAYAVFAGRDGAPSKIYLYDAIGPDAITAMMVAKSLAETQGPVEILFNTDGGDLAEGMAIAAAIADHKGETTAIITGMCGSVATICACACNTVKIGEGAYFVIHNPWIKMAGDSEDLRAMASVLDDAKEKFIAFYQRHTSATPAELLAAMSAETWIGGDTAAAKGWNFVTIPSGAPSGASFGRAAASIAAMPMPVAARMIEESRQMSASLMDREAAAIEAALGKATKADETAIQARIAEATQAAAAAAVAESAGRIEAMQASLATAAAETTRIKAEADEAKAALGRLTGGLRGAAGKPEAPKYADWASEQFRQLASR